MSEDIRVFLAPILDFDADLSEQVGRWSHLSNFLKVHGDFQSALSIGCGEGWEALALSIFLGSRETVGIDIDETKIDACRRNLEYITKQLDSTKVKLRDLSHILDNTNVAMEEELRTAIRELSDRYLTLTLPDYLCGDITRHDLNELLPAEHFDFVYCRRTLYHIFCDEEDIGHHNAKTAAFVISAFTKANGLLVSIEPEICPEEDAKAVELQDCFLCAGFSPFSDERLGSLPVGTALYKKPQKMTSRNLV